MKKVILITLLFTSAIISAQSCWFGSKGIKGNGKIITENRVVKNFDKVDVIGSFDVVLIDGKEGEISIKGEENIIPLVETIVSGNVLKIKWKKRINISKRKILIIKVAFEDINKVSLTGSGDVITEKPISSENVNINLVGSGDMKIEVNATNVVSKLSGSGDIYIFGKTENYKCVVSGSGGVDAYKLISKNTEAKLSGSGDIDVTATDKIEARVSGSGDIRYKGKPKYVDTQVSGSGNIRAR